MPPEPKAVDIARAWLGSAISILVDLGESDELILSSVQTLLAVLRDGDRETMNEALARLQTTIDKKTRPPGDGTLH